MTRTQAEPGEVLVFRTRAGDHHIMPRAIFEACRVSEERVWELEQTCGEDVHGYWGDPFGPLTVSVMHMLHLQSDHEGQPGYVPPTVGLPQ
jgi:hypothetical protein